VDGNVTKRLEHRPALDGLRAVAVLAVIAYHFGYRAAQGGFLGVDLFFVLSGFLITWLLITELASKDRISVGRFWKRRARRLLPALLVVLFAVAVYAAVIVPTNELRQVRGDAFASLFYVANWRFIFTGQSYFEVTEFPSPFRHLWSLAIEEQFYLLWPLILSVVLVCTKVVAGSEMALHRGHRRVGRTHVGYVQRRRPFTRVLRN
jgi:peptidoglycan/LPS O-acetylase OafA/YrhL